MAECAANSSVMQRALIPALGLVAIVSSVLLALAYYVDAARAHDDVVTVYMDEAKLRWMLDSLFPAGAPRRDIEYYLSNTPITHGGYDPDTRRIEGTIRAPQRLLFVPMRCPVHLVLQFDERENLASVSYDRG